MWALPLLLLSGLATGARACDSTFVVFPTAKVASPEGGCHQFIAAASAAAGDASAAAYCKLRGFAAAGAVRARTLGDLHGLAAVDLSSGSVCAHAGCRVLTAVECVRQGQAACAADANGNIGPNNVGKQNFGAGNEGNGNVGNNNHGNNNLGSGCHGDSNIGLAITGQGMRGAVLAAAEAVVELRAGVAHAGGPPSTPTPTPSPPRTPTTICPVPRPAVPSPPPSPAPAPIVKPCPPCTCPRKWPECPIQRPAPTRSPPPPCAGPGNGCPPCPALPPWCIVDSPPPPAPPPAPPAPPPGQCDNGLLQLPPAPPAPPGAPTAPDACSVWEPRIEDYVSRQCPSPCDTCIEDCASEAFCIGINDQDMPRYTSLSDCTKNTKCRSSCVQCNATHYGCFTFGA
eukprot:scaffold1.g5700.t1